jgi:hypothetical protein
MQNTGSCSEGTLDAYSVYNLIRTIMAQATSKHSIEPRSISFKGTMQTLEAFQPLIALRGEHNSEFRRSAYEHLLGAIVIHSVADRPDRYEPRRKKRRPKPYDRLMKPRHEVSRRPSHKFSIQEDGPRTMLAPYISQNRFSGYPRPQTSRIFSIFSFPELARGETMHNLNHDSSSSMRLLRTSWM